MMIEKPIRVFIMRLAAQNPNALLLRLRRLRRNVFLPHDAQEQRPGGIHDRHVRQAPIAMIGLEARDDVFVERMSRGRAQRIVADPRRRGPACPGGILQ